jgi:hypothetical protein
MVMPLAQVLQMYGRNLGLMILIAGGLHLYFHTYKRQGAKRKFDPRDLDRRNRKYFGNNQVWDNIFWSCASGITIATAYEVFFMWGYANDLLPFYLDWKKHPIWFVLTLIAIPFCSSIHFYLIHRLLHWKPLYKLDQCCRFCDEPHGPICIVASNGEVDESNKSGWTNKKVLLLMSGRTRSDVFSNPGKRAADHWHSPT